MAILQDLSIFWAMFHVIFLFIMLFRSRYTKKKTILFAGIGMGGLMLLNGAGLVLFGIEVLSKVFLITCSIPSFIFLYVMSADKRFRFLLTFCLADTTCLWIMGVENLLDFYLGGGQYILMFVSRLIVFPLIEYCVYRFLRRPYLELQDAVKKGWGVFAGMTMLYYLLLVIVVQFPTNIVNRPEDMFLCIVVLTLMVFNYGTIFSALYGQLLLYRKQQGERIWQEQHLALEAQLENQQRIRRMKHDMKGHVATLSGLITAGKILRRCGDGDRYAVGTVLCKPVYECGICVLLSETQGIRDRVQDGYSGRGREASLYGVVSDFVKRAGECLRCHKRA